MGKVFVHHPLKRAELKRLIEPPPAVAPVPLPIYEAPDPEERRRRAEARAAARRQAEEDAEKERQLFAKMSRWFGILLVPSVSFCNHLMMAYDLRDLEYLLKTKKVKSSLMGLYTPCLDTPCIHCGGRAIKKVGQGTAGVMLPLMNKFKDTDIFSFYLCDKCRLLKVQPIIFSAMRHIREMIDGRAEVDKIRRVELTQFDADFLIDHAVPSDPDPSYRAKMTQRILVSVIE